ncbi:MAG: hypothetical protein ACI8RN_002795 [Glaciecola sp.]|jgi:hypothetical protein|uniref:nuclear transport factor 2 family protein n=1 Tax=Congregibacter sp. TaxID=2744308 RepID=UPI0039E39156
MFRRCSLAFALLLVMSPGWAKPGDLSSVRTELGVLVDQFLAGASVNDVAMHQRFWSDSLVYTSSSGSRYGKQQILEGMSEPADPDEGSAVYSSDQVDVRVLADGVAVLTFRLVATSSDGAVDYFLNTGVFERVDGQWRASTWQATKVPQEGSH